MINLSFFKKVTNFIQSITKPSTTPESFKNKTELLQSILPNSISNSLQVNDKYYVKAEFFSKREFKFYKRLKALVYPVYDVFFEVALSSIIELNPKQHLTDQQKNLLFKEYANKRLDFVLIDQSGNIFCVIELDDSSHNTAKAKKYDELKNNILHIANIPIIRISQYDELTQEQLFLKLFKLKA